MACVSCCYGHRLLCEARQQGHELLVTRQYAQDPANQVGESGGGNRDVSDVRVVHKTREAGGQKAAEVGVDDGPPDLF